MMNDVLVNEDLTGINYPAPVDDSITLFVMGGISIVVAMVTTVEYNKPYLLYSIADAEALGITEDYDTNNEIVVWEHINDYFSAAPGQPLWIYIVTQSTPAPTVLKMP
jgi:hypothetical protein